MSSAFPALAAEKTAREYRIAQEELERAKPRKTSRGTRRTPTRAERLESKGERTRAVGRALEPFLTPLEDAAVRGQDLARSIPIPTAMMGPMAAPMYAARNAKDWSVGESAEAARAAAGGDPNAYFQDTEPTMRRTRGGMVETGGSMPTQGLVDTALFGSDVAGLGASQPVKNVARYAATEMIPGMVEDLAMAGARGAPGIIDRVNTLPGMVSTRQPGVRSPEYGELTDLTISLDALRRDPKAFESHLDVMEAYPGIRPNTKRTLEARAQNIIDQETENLLYLWDRAGPEKTARNRQWYTGANRVADKIRGPYTKEQAAGVIAALSPQNFWDNNVSIAQRLIRMRANPPAYDARMTAKLDEIAPNISEKGLVDSVKNKEFDELTNNRQRAVWLRAYDEATQDRTMRAVLPTGEFGDVLLTQVGKPRLSAWKDTKSIEKALNILDDGSVENVSANLGNAHKVRNFYNSIIYPKNLRGEMVGDTHAAGAAVLTPVSASSPEAMHLMGSSVKGMVNPKRPANSGIFGTYPLVQEGYRQAAREANALPKEMQSVTWEEARDLFPGEMKRSKQALQQLLDAQAAVKSGLMSRAELLRVFEDVPKRFRKK